MDAALSHLSTRARTVREMERYLDTQQYGEYEVQQVVDRLQELGYLDDAAYAEDFVRTRLAAKPVSRRRLYEQLHAHELPKEIIEAALRDVPDEDEQENAQRVAEKFATQFAHLPQDELAKRVMRRLTSRGFSYEDARAALEAAVEGLDLELPEGEDA